MGLGNMSKKVNGGISAVETEPIKRIVSYDLEELTDVPGGGYTISFCGFPNTGKTMTAVLLGNLQKKLLPLWKDKFPKTAKALENGTIPEVKEIWIIDSENAIKKQLPREKNLLKYIYGKIPIKVITIPEVNIDYVVDSKNNKVKMTQQSIDEIFDIVSLYNTIIDDFAKQTDGNSLLIIDSGSRFKKLVDMKSTITFNISVEERGEEYVKQMGFNKWGNRNAMWEKTMTKIRGTPGWVVVTFKTQINKEWVLKMLRKKGHQPQETKTIMLDGTAHNMDMMYDFDFSKDAFKINISTRVGRYVNREITESNNIEIDEKYRFSTLQLVEHLVTEVTHDDFFD